MLFGGKRRTARSTRRSRLSVTEVYIDRARSNPDRVRLNLRGRLDDGSDVLWEGECRRCKVPRVGTTLPVTVDDSSVIEVQWSEVPVDVDPPVDALFSITLTRQVGERKIVIDMAEIQPLIERFRRDGGLPPADMQRLLYLLGERDD